MDRRQFAPEARVIGSGGEAIGSLVIVDGASQPPSIVVLLESDGRQVRIPVSQIDETRSTDEQIVVTISGEELLRSEAATWNQAETSQARQDAERLTIPLAGEELVASTREVEKGKVIVRKRVETTPYQESVSVDHDEVDVDRVTVNQDINEVPAVRHEGATMIVPVVEEVLVVEKRLRLVEEVRITKRRVTGEETVHEELRREVVDIDTEGTPTTGIDR